MRLRHTNRKPAHASLGQPIDPLLAFGQKLNVGGAVEAARQRQDLLSNWRALHIQWRELASLLGGVDYRPGQLDGAVASSAEAIVDHGCIGTKLHGELGEQLQLAIA